MKVAEIFNSIEGEGKRAGLPATFIRLHGCNLRCSYCDSMYAVEGNDYQELSISEIMRRVKLLECSNITITGGEPLIHEDIDELIRELKNANYFINVETNGTVKPRIRGNNIFYTVDYKTGTSGMMEAMKRDVFIGLFQTDVIKFVVGSKEDLDDARKFTETLKGLPAQIYVGPVFGKIQPLEIVDYVKDHELWNWHMQLQLHKILWNPQERGV